MKARITALVVAGALLAACGAAPAAPAETISLSPLRSVDIVLNEFSITPFGVEEGETVVFNVTNEGAVAHEFRFTSPDMVHEHERGHGDMGDVLALAAGESGTLTVTFDEGYTRAACLLPGHYEAGMFTDIATHEGDHS